jgi:Plasmid pRiA4b ORF-3-like protein
VHCAIGLIMTTRSAIDSFTEIATLRIELRDSDPLIWRVVEVPTSITLKVLHDIVQVSMGWCDYHLWEMVIEGKTYGLAMDEDFGPALGRWRIRSVCAMY